jgi:DNA topoisomerase VI subunit A
MVRHLVGALNIPVYALTDYNPHGMALMLCYKYGSVTFAFEQYCCPQLKWLGLHSADVHESLEGMALPKEAFQAFTKRDMSVLDGLLRRSVVNTNAILHREAMLMYQAQGKVEIEALHHFGFEHLSQMLVRKIVMQTDVQDSGELNLEAYDDCEAYDEPGSSAYRWSQRDSLFDDFDDDF